MKIWIVIGTNGILNAVGPVGASATAEGAERIRKANEWKLDTSAVFGPFDVEDLEAEIP